MGARKTVISGAPDVKHISTSMTEWQNLSMRMGMRQFTRLTNPFSKKLENHEHALALYFMYYNFARIHQALRVTPAMEAGIADQVWSLEEIVALVHKRAFQSRSCNRGEVFCGGTDMGVYSRGGFRSNVDEKRGKQPSSGFGRL
jgi:hypothetical protein